MVMPQFIPSDNHTPGLNATYCKRTVPRESDESNVMNKFIVKVFRNKQSNPNLIDPVNVESDEYGLEKAHMQEPGDSDLDSCLSESQ
jgi:hypothetical protein